MYAGGIWLCDFEFRPADGVEGNLPRVICMVAREYGSRRTIRLWEDELARLTAAPFPTDKSALFVAYYASAEIGCFQALGWPEPENILDLFIEFRCRTNGISTIAGSGLTGALTHYGLPTIGSRQKDELRQLALRGGPWTPDEKVELLDYCESDVVALDSLLRAMAPRIDWPRALLRGRYAATAASIETAGIPIDMETLTKLRANWEHIQDRLIAEIDADFGGYDGRTFRQELFSRYLVENNITWPLLSTGRLDLETILLVEWRSFTRSWRRCGSCETLYRN
jgi:DNA polymerase I